MWEYLVVLIAALGEGLETIVTSRLTCTEVDERDRRVAARGVSDRTEDCIVSAAPPI